jgi:DNA-binding transcriptional ArsR family regulator
LSNPILVAVAVRRRRLVLSVLQNRTSPVSERELATQLVAIEGEKSPVDVTREEVATIHADLVHAQLPRLEAASLVARDTDEGTVTTTDHPALDDPHFQEIVETDADGWDAVVANLARPQRRTILAVLEDRDGSLEDRDDSLEDRDDSLDDRDDSLDDRDEPMAVADLAAAVRGRETGDESPADASTDVLASLHHVHLPKLERAGLLAYDADEGTVTYEGHPKLDETWFDPGPDETPRPVLTVARDSPDSWTVEDCENAFEHGRSIVD